MFEVPSGPLGLFLFFFFYNVLRWLSASFPARSPICATASHLHPWVVLGSTFASHRHLQKCCVKVNQTTGTTSQNNKTRLINCPPPSFLPSPLHVWEMFHLSPPLLLCFIRLALLSHPLFLYFLSCSASLVVCWKARLHQRSLLHQHLKLAFTPEAEYLREGVHLK